MLIWQKGKASVGYEALGGAPEQLVIDLSGCTFLDSAGIRTLVGAARDRAGTSRLRIVTADPGIVRLLEITGVDTLIHVHPSVDAAL